MRWTFFRATAFSVSLRKQFVKVTGTDLCAVEENDIIDVLLGIQVMQTAAK